jgi:hypothetical protein
MAFRSIGFVGARFGDALKVGAGRSDRSAHGRRRII